MQDSIKSCAKKVEVLQAEDILRENGAVMKEAFPMMPKVTVDRELVTAQQPSSAVAFGEAFVKALTKA